MIQQLGRGSAAGWRQGGSIIFYVVDEEFILNPDWAWNMEPGTFEMPWLLLVCVACDRLVRLCTMGRYLCGKWNEGSDRSAEYS